MWRTYARFDLVPFTNDLLPSSFFGTQEGDFDLTLRTIEAVTIDGDEEKHRVEDESERGKAKGHGSDSETEDPVVLEKGAGYREARDGEPRQQQSWLSWIFGRCWKL